MAFNIVLLVGGEDLSILWLTLGSTSSFLPWGDILSLTMVAMTTGVSGFRSGAASDTSHFQDDIG